MSQPRDCRQILVLGASGAIGRFLLPRLLGAGHEVLAVSRVPRASAVPRLRWVVGNLDSGVPECATPDVIFSLGPLDAFARWFAQARLDGAPRVIAFGSMSVDSKRDSDDAGERALAARLQAAEQALIASADARGCAWTLFRPTLIYGAGVDRSLTPIARFAQRWRVFPRMVGASGLRQPVHADDLAAACIAALATLQTAGKTYALGGGERLAFVAMLERVRASLPVRTLPLPIPLGAARALVGAARAAGLHASSGAAIDRLTRDLVADHSAAVADFGWAPRPFHPDARMWSPA
ncbi:NAD-dependent epimerase/dehydratase family protein [Dokdonella soli]|uniref:NAD-dependent epimerase/dehydratase family protein n=1 Tax=Dokdonella soli TaxID=529810 RepID=A0ABP3TUR1_9GAMM